MIALFSMVRKPFNFDTWIEYHLSLGFDYIYLRVEETPEISSLLDKYKDKVIVEYDNFINKRDNYLGQMDRQKDFANKVIQDCIIKSVDWLAHIDSDELIWCGDSILDLLVGIEPDVDYINIKNYEAIYSFDNLENPFLQTNTFISSDMMAYNGGKSMGRVSPRLEFGGPHAFNGKYHNIETKRSVILHFESATFEKWYDKFSNKSNFDEPDTQGMKESMIDETKNEVKQVPLEFCKESSRLARLGDLEKCREYYNKMKVCRYNPNTWRLYWTPLLPQKNSHWLR